MIRPRFSLPKIKESDLLNIIYPVVTFIISVCLMLILLSNNGFYPFVKNGKTLLTIDMQGQYVAFFKYFKRVLAGEYNLIYTLGKAYGGDMHSIFSYYLSSPFNLLIVFFSQKDIPIFFVLITILKVSFTGVTACIALKSILKNGLATILLALSYAFISYNFAYHHNIMWLDGVMILPLVVLGINHIVQGKSAVLYVCSLTYGLFTSWYIGYMLCVFSIIWIAYQLVINKKFKYRQIAMPALIFTFASLAAGLLASPNWYLAIYNMHGTKGGGGLNLIKNITTNLFSFYDSFNNLGKSFAISSFSAQSITNDGISIYVGTFAAFVAVLYFFNQKFTYKERIASGMLVLFFILTFFSNGLTLLWHGGAYPTWFPYRYVFIFSFVIIYLAAKSLENIKHIKLWALPIPAVLYFILILIIDKARNDDYTFKVISIFLIICTILGILLLKLNKKRCLDYAIIGCLIGINSYNMFANADHIFKSINESFRYLPIQTYNQDGAIQDVIDYVKNRDTTLYRMEKTFMRQSSYNRANNDAMYYGYNGLSHYSSNEKQEVMFYHNKLGFHYNGFWEDYGSGNTISVNSYLGVKYILDRPSNEKYAPANYLTTIITGEDGIRISENQYTLPLAFMTRNTDIHYISEGYGTNNGTYWYDHFEYQNQIFKAISDRVVDDEGKPKDIFKKATYTIKLSNGISANANPMHYTATEPNESITYEVSRTQDYPYYYFFKNSYNAYLYVNNGYVDFFNYWYYQINPYTFPNGNLANKGNIKITLRDPIDNQEIREEIYYEDLDVLEEYISEIRKNSITDITFKGTTYYQGDVTVNEDRRTLLFTLPYEKDFKVYVDNKQVPTFKRFNIFLAAELPVGLHNVKIVYSQPKTLVIAASFISLTAIIAYCLKRKLFEEKLSQLIKVSYYI